MPQNFLYPQRDQPLLLPVDMREWLPEDDLVFVVLDAVATLDLSAFRRRYRADGHGRAAFDPQMMVALLLYGYCQGERSSRMIEQRCVRDVGYRVILAGLRPDHAIIARFRARHEKAVGELFSQVLRLLAEAASADAAEDAQHGETGQPATPRILAGRAERRERPARARDRLAPRMRPAVRRSGRSSKRGMLPRQRGCGAGAAPAASRPAPTVPEPRRGRTSPTRTCG